MANIFSTNFIVECGDGSINKKSFRKEWKRNMHESEDAVIERYTKEDFTCITFYPDLKIFKLKKMTSDIVNLLKKECMIWLGFLIIR